MCADEPQIEVSRMWLDALYKERDAFSQGTTELTRGSTLGIWSRISLTAKRGRGRRKAETQVADKKRSSEGVRKNGRKEEKRTREVPADERLYRGRLRLCRRIIARR